jgi:MFS family permease
VDDRTRALQEIAATARQHRITTAEIAAALGESPATTTEGHRRAMLVRVLGFLGGTFVFAGIGVFIALQWDGMSPAARVVATLGPGITAFVLAVLASRDARFEKATTPMTLTAAALEPTGMLVAFEEFGSGGDWRVASLVTAATMALQFGAAFVAIRRSITLFLAVFFGNLFWWTAFDLLDFDGGLIAVILGGATLLAAARVDRTAHRDITPLWYLLGSAAFLSGLFDLVERTPFEILFLAVAAGFVYLSVMLHSRALLIVATLAILGYTGWYTRQYFADSIGWPLALIAFGMLMIGLSALAFRIDRDYVRRV